MICFLSSYLKPKVNPALYNNVLQARAEQSDHYSFLPKQIPQNAEKVAFFHIPGFLQGGDVIVLRLSLPAESIQSILKELEDSGRIKIEEFKDIPPPYSYPEYGMKKPGSKNMVEGVSKLPEDFQIFLFKCDLADIEKNWNHNIMSFTAVSQKRNEVVYFIDNW